jgi:hypothetical protein
MIGAGTSSHARDAKIVRVLYETLAPKTGAQVATLKGAGKAGCPMHPQPRVQLKKHTS